MTHNQDPDQNKLLRLLGVAKATREASPAMFTMKWVTHPCRTPACAMGNYAARSDIQQDLTIDRFGSLSTTGGESVWFWNDEAYEFETTLTDYFGITGEQINELFETNGCGNAQTPEQAADYIENFVTEELARRAQCLEPST